MRISQMGLTLILLLTFLLCSVVQGMEDPVTATPDMYKTLHENDQVRVLEVVYLPRSARELARASAYHCTSLTRGTEKSDKNDEGEVHEYELKVGQNLLTGPVEKHRGMNPGTSSIRVLAVELKQER